MTESSTRSFKVFSVSDAQLLAECGECGKVLKVPRDRIKEVPGGFEVRDGLVCPCGHKALRIDSPPPKAKPLEKKPSFVETILAQALIWGVLAAILIGAGYIVVAIVGAFDNGIDREPVPNLTAAVRVSSGQVHVTNNDSFDWTACKITLNAGFGGSWSQRVGRIPAGSTVSGGLMSFTRARGERFNPITHAVEDILVQCSTPAGLSFWAGRL